MQKGKEMKKCEDCVSRYLCFLAGTNEGCLAHNDKETFWLYMRVHFQNRNIKKLRKMIEDFQAQDAEERKEE